MPELTRVPGLTPICLLRVGGGLALALVAALGCRSPKASIPPSIEFTHLPRAGQGHSESVETIEGRVIGAQPGQRIVLFARSGGGGIQPHADQPFTAIQPDSKWKNVTH